MLFFGQGVVWDKAKNKELCKFEKGEYETNDTRIITILKENNYKFEEEVKNVTEKVENVTKVEPKKIAQKVKTKKRR